MCCCCCWLLVFALVFAPRSLPSVSLPPSVCLHRSCQRERRETRTRSASVSVSERASESVRVRSPAQLPMKRTRPEQARQPSQATQTEGREAGRGKRACVCALWLVSLWCQCLDPCLCSVLRLGSAVSCVSPKRVRPRERLSESAALKRGERGGRSQRPRTALVRAGRARGRVRVRVCVHASASVSSRAMCQRPFWLPSGGGPAAHTVTESDRNTHTRASEREERKRHTEAGFARGRFFLMASPLAPTNFRPR